MSVGSGQFPASQTILSESYHIVTGTPGTDMGLQLYSMVDFESDDWCCLLWCLKLYSTILC